MEETEIQQQQRAEEQKVLNLMLNKGFNYAVPMRSPLRALSKTKVRVFKFRKPYTGTMDYLAEVGLQMYYNADNIMQGTNENVIYEKNILIRRNAKLLSRSLAIAWLNSFWKIKLFSGVMSFYFRWHTNSELDQQAADLIDTLSDAGTFINSIRLMSGMKRTTQPKSPELIEESQKAKQ